MSYFMVDVESDGPIPGDYSMTSIGCVLVEEPLTKTFAAKLKPISENYRTEALAVSGMTRRKHLLGEHPKEAMTKFGCLDRSAYRRKVDLRVRQQRLRLDVCLLVLPPLSGDESFRL